MNGTVIGGYGLPVGVVAASLLAGVAGPRWALLTACLTAVCAFLAGRRPTEGRGGRGAARAAALVLVGALALDMAAVALVPGWLVPGTRFVAVLVAAGVLPWFAGRVWQLYRELTRAGWERAEQLERERRLVAEQARLRERSRIAQDMHDVLGHELSLIALSAGALKLAPGLDEGQRGAADDIRTRAGTAVERLGEVIGVLREEADAPPTGPTEPSGTGVTRLVSEASASGLDVEARIEGEREEIPEAVLRAVHRVVQEGLTNVAKHAPGTRATVRVTHAEAETTVEVENGPGRRPGPRLGPGTGGQGIGGQGIGGHGLVGLDERVRLAGGTFDGGPSEDGGFAVRARLPHAPPAAQGTRASGVEESTGEEESTGVEPPAAGETRSEHSYARRRLRRTLLASLTVPLAATALAGGGLTLWDMVLAERSVLDPADFARLRAGQDRSEVAPYLPDRQTSQRPAETPSAGHGTRCEFYAMTADRFDDRSGDVYRLCFRGDTLVSARALVGR
ncbi:sensor histidine kinase [Streptomyces sp. NPDC048172]|uniref:sensor histidine kinase n=1 Tax=Streptomyces sp. NPDC048172 TaxID=3365505 RepID=UPI003718BFD4